MENPIDISETKSIFITYDCNTNRFIYPKDVNVKDDRKMLWDIFIQEDCASVSTARHLQKTIEDLSLAKEDKVVFAEYFIKDINVGFVWSRVSFVRSIRTNTINIIFTNIDSQITEQHRFKREIECDKLTGLYNRKAFAYKVGEIINEDALSVAKGQYAMVYFDVNRFKAVNDVFGMTEGDRLLRYIADTVRDVINVDDVACRIGQDRFVFFTKSIDKELNDIISTILERIDRYELAMEIVCNFGIYITDDEQLNADLMVDRAILAQSVIKGSYTKKYNYYTEDLRKEMLTEQEITGMMSEALAAEDFVIYYQPQYDHSTGKLVGAEALVRWLHPDKGLISPGVFIPIFEKNGFITKIDLYVFEKVCRFIRYTLDKGYNTVPISTNFSRHDIFQQDFVESLENIRKKYNVDSSYLRVEITESAIMGGNQHVNEVIEKLHNCGYVVEMDDFGSGYSSLNVLKDIELDVIKLDMLFLSDKNSNNRGGTILSSVVRMAKWLGLPVIAEGVEKIEQADFLKSIGCNYIQGYLYSRPLPQKEYEDIIRGNRELNAVSQMEMTEIFDANNFWNPLSHDTIIFNNYVGGAAILDYNTTTEQVEILRVNEKYILEMGLGISEKEIIDMEPLAVFDDNNKAIYISMLKSAIESNDEEECETWRTLKDADGNIKKLYLRSNVRLIGRAGDNYVFYATIRNITKERLYYNEILNSEKRFKAASEQNNMYYWEYIVDTHEMIPCYRCIRDLGVPGKLSNYPESAIEMGIFPPEVADLYRDWHRQIEEGVQQLEAIMPLTKDRIMHKVKYTVETDNDGKPVKAYGSAIKID